MLKIACIGCSWTEGVNIHHTHTYPYILHEKLLEQNVKNQVINAGRCAASLDYYPYVIQFLEKEFNPDYYIIQLTTHCLLYTSPSPRDLSTSRMPSSA